MNLILHLKRITLVNVKNSKELKIKGLLKNNRVIVEFCDEKFFTNGKKCIIMDIMKLTLFQKINS